MDGLDINALITLSPTIAVLLYITFNQQKRIDSILDRLLKYCPPESEDDEDK